MNRYRKIITVVAGLLLLAALGLRLHLYVMGARHLPVTTDEAITVLQAKQVQRGEFPVLMMAQPYMFPLEAYWMAPLEPFLPRTAAGMRVLAVIEGLIFLALILQVLRRIGTWQEVWPGALLALFPSIYLVMNQFAYSQPHNNSAFILALAAAWCALGLDDTKSRRNRWLALGAGFFAVFAFSNGMLAVTLSAPILLVAVCRVHWKRWPVHLPLLAGGGLFGLLPYLVARLLHPGAYQSVSATFSLPDALERLWSPAISYTLPVTFGFTPCLFPDSRERIAFGEFWSPVFSILFAALLIGVAVIGLYRIGRALTKDHTPRMGALEMFFGISLLSLLLFTFSKRADSHAYRYLVPIVVAFPGLVAAGYRWCPSKLRILPGGLAIALAVFNAGAAIRLPVEWKKPGFATDIMSCPDLQPAIEFLREQDIEYSYASHWAAYRINFLTDETILCSQPYNERFPGWPIPYKARVDAADRAAYVLTEKIRFLKPHIFERHLRTMGIQAEKHIAGDFAVYYNFARIDSQPGERIPGNDVRVTAEPGGDDTGRMLDGDPSTRWLSVDLQQAGYRIDFTFNNPQPVTRLELDYGRYSHDMAARLTVRVRMADGEWRTAHENLPPVTDKFSFDNGRPIYGGSRRTLPFDGQPIQAVRLEIADPSERFCWTVAEAAFYRVDDTPASTD